MSAPHYSVTPSNLSNGRSQRPQRRRVSLIDASAMTGLGRVKWYEHDKRYGFIECDGRSDVFLHWSTAQLYGLNASDLVKGQTVRFNSEQKPGRRPEATAIALD